MRMSRSNWVALLVFLMFTFMAGLWLMDVSVGAMNTGGELIGLVVRNPDPMITYHIGLGVSALSCFSMALIAVHHVLGGM